MVAFFIVPSLTWAKPGMYLAVLFYCPGKKFCVLFRTLVFVLPLLPTVVKIAGIIWKVCYDETGQSCSFLTFARLENSDPGKTNRAQ